MTVCNICGEKIEEGSRTCSVCGSSVEEFIPTHTSALRPPTEARPTTPVPKGGRSCPSCGAVYGPKYSDGFCACGTGLVAAGEPERVSKLADDAVIQLQEEVPIAVVEESPPMAPILDEAPPMAAIVEEAPVAVEAETPPDMKVRGAKPSPGTPCLVLYGPDKQPLQYFALTKDAMLIGRLDAVAGHFPDIDLDEWFDRATIRRISRQHALILRSRATGTFVLRPLVGNTGTQLEAQMLSPQQDYPLTPGHRIILGGVIRLKFEIA
jgi:hypothetical protein